MKAARSITLWCLVILLASSGCGKKEEANVGTDAKPVFAAEQTILFRGKHCNHVRANLGECVDWDVDGKQDLIGCEFENNIRFHKNTGSGAAGDEPRFASRGGVIIVEAYSWQMISGADVIDFNGDGDLDILTGQGHGGSGLRFYERDYIEDGLNDTRPRVSINNIGRKPDKTTP